MHSEESGGYRDEATRGLHAQSAGNDGQAAIACDVVVVGCGAAGLYTALNLPRSLKVVMLSKGPFEDCDSMLAQGGICVLHDEDDYDAFFEDTMRAGHYENRPESVDIMIRSSRAAIDDLVRLGVRFARTPGGELDYTREAAHSRARICYHEDITGHEITSVLQRRVGALPNVEMMELCEMVDIIEDDGICAGVLAECTDGRRLRIESRYTVLATGGIGGLYEHSTNFPEMTGDGCRIASAHGVELENMDYVQIHPTSLYTGRPGRAFLISESARGEGAILIDRDGNRFTDELQPRDVVTAAVYAQMEKEGSEFVRMSFENVPRGTILNHFRNIYSKCLEEGYDITREPIPVTPAQHYFMGGIHVDTDSQTTMPRLFAVGETSCNGVHGANRLASNSLLESLVFGKRAAEKIAREISDGDAGAAETAAAREACHER